MLSDEMEVDTEQQNSGSMSASSSSDILGKINLDALNNNLTAFSKNNYWRDRLDANECRPFSHLILYEILVKLLWESGEVDGMIKESDIFVMLQRLGDGELEDLKATVRECAEENDWKALIVHRTYIWITTAGSRLTATTAMLRSPKVSNVVVGVPIEYSALHFFPFHCTTVLTFHSSFVLAQRMVRYVHDPVITY